MDHPAANQSKMVLCLTCRSGSSTRRMDWGPTCLLEHSLRRLPLSMEVFRHLRNSMRQLTLRAKSGLLEKFITKMWCSGYQEGTVRGILQSGLQYFYRQLTLDLQGGPHVNNRDDTNKMLTRRKKLVSKQSWFARRRGGEAEKFKKEQGWRSATVTMDLGPNPGGRRTGWAAGDGVS